MESLNHGCGCTVVRYSAALTGGLGKGGDRRMSRASMGALARMTSLNQSVVPKEYQVSRALRNHPPVPQHRHAVPQPFRNSSGDS